MCKPGRSLLASLRRPPPGRVSIPGLGLPTYRPLCRVQPRFILPCRRAPSEFLRLDSRAHPFGERTPTRVLLPLRDMTVERPPTVLCNPERLPAESAGSATSPLRSALRLSQPLGGLLRSAASRAYSIPQPRPGYLSSRGFSLRAATLAFTRSCPLAIGPPDARRPRTTSTSGDLDFEAFIHTEQRCFGLVLPAPSLAPLVEFCPPPGFQPRPTRQLPGPIRSWSCRRPTLLPCERNAMRPGRASSFLKNRGSQKCPLISPCLLQRLSSDAFDQLVSDLVNLLEVPSHCSTPPQYTSHSPHRLYQPKPAQPA
jgi:hypothetical protein